MTPQPSAALDTIQIRYRISYLTWLRMKAWTQHSEFSMSQACGLLLAFALDRKGVTADPGVLLGLPKGSPEG